MKVKLDAFFVRQMCQISSGMWSLFVGLDSDSGVIKFGTPNSDAGPKNPDFVSIAGPNQILTPELIV